MQRLNYPLKTYVKAVEILLERKKFGRLDVYYKKGSVVRFDLFLKREFEPTTMWVVHTEHSKARRIISREDYKKAAVRLNSSLEEFEEILKNL